MDIQPELATVQGAVSESAQEVKPEKTENPMGTYTFRIPNQIRAQAEDLCQRSGSSLPSFLRKCCEIMVREYSP